MNGTPEKGKARPIEVGDHVQVYYCDDTQIEGDVEHVPQGTGDMWVIRTATDTQHINPVAGCLAAIARRDADEASPEYPPEVREKVEVLDEYKVVPFRPAAWHIVHLYPKELAYPSGYYDSRCFDLWVFNEESQEKALIEHRDGLKIQPGVDIDVVRIFADGSTLIRFKHPVRISPLQAAVIARAEEGMPWTL